MARNPARPDIVVSMQHEGARTAGILENLAHLETLPFDGMVVQIPDSWNAFKPGWEGAAEDLDVWLDPLDGVFERLTANYLFLAIDDPGDLFDDAAWAQAVANVGELAAAAARHGFKGILFDNEEYFQAWTNFPENYPPEDAARGLDAYREQARQRGREVAEAVDAAFPDAVVSVLHGPYVSTPGEAGDPPGIEGQVGDASLHELTGPFFTGMAEGAGPQMRLLDGGMLYALRSRADFARMRDHRLTDTPDRIDWPADPALLEGWEDRIGVSHKVYTEEFPTGFPQTPASFERSLINAALHSDDVVFAFSELGQFDWLSAEGLPDRWLQAAQRAMADLEARPDVDGRLAGLVGGAGDDALSGHRWADVIHGRRGDDRLAGLDGEDWIDGAAGRDRLIGGAGDDRAYGGGGDDRASGGGGADLLRGRAGADVLMGGAGADDLRGDGRADRLSGGGGPDALRGGAGPDRLFGGQGADDLRGGPGADRLFGGDGDDRLSGGTGADLLAPGAGADVIVFAADHGATRLRGFEAGVDRIALIDGPESFAALDLSDAPGGALLRLGAATLLFEGSSVADLAPEDFGW